MNRIVVLCGPSGCGKSSLLRLLFRDFPALFGFSVSHTSRKPRKGEVADSDYHFVDREKMLEMRRNCDFVESAEFGGNLYGTSFQALESVLASKSVILDVDMQGVIQLKAKLRRQDPCDVVNSISEINSVSGAKSAASIHTENTINELSCSRINSDTINKVTSGRINSDTISKATHIEAQKLEVPFNNHYGSKSTDTVFISKLNDNPFSGINIAPLTLDQKWNDEGNLNRAVSHKLIYDSVFIFLAPPSIGELEARLRGRGTESEESIVLRLTAAKKEIEWGTVPNIDHRIVNDDLDACYSKVKQILGLPEN